MRGRSACGFRGLSPAMIGAHFYHWEPCPHPVGGGVPHPENGVKGKLVFARRRRRPSTPPFPGAAGCANRGRYLVPGDSGERKWCPGGPVAAGGSKPLSPLIGHTRRRRYF